MKEHEEHEEERRKKPMPLGECKLFCVNLLDS